MRKHKNLWRLKISRRHYVLTRLELWLWKLWADLTQMIKHRRLPKKRTARELREASLLLKTWLRRDREERRTHKS